MTHKSKFIIGLVSAMITFTLLSVTVGRHHMNMHHPCHPQCTEQSSQQ